MVLAYQLLFIILVIGSSFFGLKAFFMTVMCCLLFTLVNVFTLPLLMLQSTVILGAGTIGLLIAIIVSLRNSSESFSEYMRRMDSKSLKSALLYVVFVLIGLMLYRRIYSYMYYYVYMESLSGFFRFILAMPALYFVFIVPGKISDRFKLESGGCGCVFIGLMMIFILRNMGLFFI